MHVLLEGALPLHCKLVLRHCIVDKKYFTLEYLNRQVTNFKYGYTETVNKPRLIDRERISGNEKIVQSGKIIWYNMHTVFTRITGTLYSKGHFGLT